MAILRRERLLDGTFGDLEKVGSSETQAETIERLETQSRNLMLALTDLYEFILMAEEEPKK